MITPHLTSPFSFVGGAAQVDDQGSSAEITSSISNIVRCFVGDCPDIPSLGIPNPLFQNAPVNVSGIVQAIATWEPRAEVDVTESASPLDPSERLVNVEILNG